MTSVLLADVLALLRSDEATRAAARRAMTITVSEEVVVRSAQIALADLVEQRLGERTTTGDRTEGAPR